MTLPARRRERHGEGPVRIVDQREDGDRLAHLQRGDLLSGRNVPYRNRLVCSRGERVVRHSQGSDRRCDVVRCSGC